MKNEFVTQISYSTLRQIIVDYFKNSENIELGYYSIEYLQDTLSGENKYQSSSQPYFSMENELGKTNFDIPNEDIFKILDLYMSKMGFKLNNVKYENVVKITYGFLNLAQDSIMNEETKDIDYSKSK